MNDNVIYPPAWWPREDWTTTFARCAFALSKEDQIALRRKEIDQLRDSGQTPYSAAAILFLSQD